MVCQLTRWVWCGEERVWGGQGAWEKRHSTPENPQLRLLPGKLASIWRHNPLCEVEKATAVRDIRHLLRPQMITSAKAPLTPVITV